MEEMALEIDFLVIIVLFISIIISSIFLIVIYFRKQRQLIKKMRHLYLDVGEAERERLSFELHDQVAISTSVLESELTKSNIQDSLKERLLGLVSEMKFNISKINDGIYPAITEETQFKNTLEDLSRIFPSTEIALSYQSVYIDSCPQLSKVHIYRIIQEICVNAIKHSGAEFIEITIQDLEYPKAEIEIVYNCTKPVSHSIAGSRGKKIVKERMKRLNATWHSSNRGDIKVETISLYEE